MLRLCTDNLLISVVLAFVLGAVVAFAFSADLGAAPLLLALLPVFLLLTLLTWILPVSWRPLTTLPFFFCVGLAHTHAALEPSPDPLHIDGFIQNKQQVTLIGRVHSMVEFDGQKSRFLLQSEEILLHQMPPAAVTDRPQPVQGLVQISMPGAPPAQLRPGVSIMVLVQLRPIRSFQSPGAFNYRLYMASEGISCTGWAQSSQAILILDDPGVDVPWQTLLTLPERMRQHSAFFLQQHYPPEIAGIYQALLIGSRVNISPQIQEYFAASGCLHILSISGLHMSLLGVFSFALLRFLLKQSQWLLLHNHVPSLALLLTAPVLLLYGFLAGLNAPAMRAMLTALLVLLAVSLRAQRSMLHLLSAAVLIILALQPLALFTVSFQLSFAAVLAIICIYPRLPLFQDYPSTLSNASWSRKILFKAIRFVQSMLYISLAATAGTLPFLLYHFNRVSLVAPVMNLIVEPLLCYWTLPCGLLALPLLALAPDLANLLLDFGAHGIRLALFLTELVAAWSWISLWTITPNFFEIFLYFFIFFLLLLHNKKAYHWLAILLASGLLGASFSNILWQNEPGQELRIDVLDVGQGNAVVLRLPDDSVVVIDGGGSAGSTINSGEAVIAPFLWQQRLWRINELIVSHPHSDHYNGLPFIIERFRPQHLIINTDPGTETDYHALLAQARQRSLKIVMARAGDIIKRGKDFQLLCLGMSGSAKEENSWSANDRSLVLRLQGPWHSFLFPGDITAKAEQILQDADKLAPVDVLLAPHHGSRYSLSPDFVNALSPSLIVVSSSINQQGTLPATKHVQRWRQEGQPFFITAKHGNISMVSRAESLQISAYEPNRHPLTRVRKRLPAPQF